MKLATKKKLWHHLWLLAAAYEFSAAYSAAVNKHPFLFIWIVGWGIYCVTQSAVPLYDSQVLQERDARRGFRNR